MEMKKAHNATTILANCEQSRDTWFVCGGGGESTTVMVWWCEKLCMTWCMDNCVCAMHVHTHTHTHLNTICQLYSMRRTDTRNRAKQLSMCNVYINFCDIRKFNFVSFLFCMRIMSSSPIYSVVAGSGSTNSSIHTHTHSTEYQRYERFVMNNKNERQTPRHIHFFSFSFCRRRLRVHHFALMYQLPLPPKIFLEFPARNSFQFIVVVGDAIRMMKKKCTSTNHNESEKWARHIEFTSIHVTLSHIDALTADLQLVYHMNIASPMAMTNTHTHPHEWKPHENHIHTNRDGWSRIEKKEKKSSSVNITYTHRFYSFLLVSCLRHALFSYWVHTTRSHMCWCMYGDRGFLIFHVTLRASRRQKISDSTQHSLHEFIVVCTHTHEYSQRKSIFFLSPLSTSVRMVLFVCL